MYKGFSIETAFWQMIDEAEMPMSELAHAVSVAGHWRCGFAAAESLVRMVRSAKTRNRLPAWWIPIGVWETGLDYVSPGLAQVLAFKALHEKIDQGIR